jgi:branched-chain amino acid transport system ATP-binding protein
VLRASGVTVTFGGIHALDDVDISADPGMVTGLIGPNGAGKTTLFNVITGLQRPTTGSVWLEGVDITRARSGVRARMGMARTFQRLEIFGSMSARDNVLVALETRGGAIRNAAQRREEADRLLGRVGLASQADTFAAVLSTGSARLLELARALARRPKVLLLDEVSSGLDSEESIRVGNLLTELANDGIAVLLVEHDMDMVMSVCRIIHVLDFGMLIASGRPAEIRADPRVQTAYLGSEQSAEDQPEKVTSGEDSDD